MGQTIHHHAITQATCPVKALAHRIYHVMSHKGTSSNLLCDVWNDETQEWTQVTSKHMTKSLRLAVQTLGLHKNGIDADLVGPHSLRAGGAMALKLTGADDTTIMKMGRWSGLTFLQYIHN